MCSSDDNRSTGGCDKGIVKMIHWYTIDGFSVSFSYEKNQSGEYNVDNITSGLSGVQLGLSWTHENSISSTVEGKIRFKVNGKRHWNIVVEGIGTVYTEDIELTGEYDPCTGDYKIKANEK